MASSEASLALDQTFFGALAAGLLSFLSPCVLPLVPAYLCFLTGMELDALSGKGGSGETGAPLPATAARGHAFARAFWFVLGFATVFIALGATASTIGRFVAAWFDVMAIAAGVLIAAMGLHFLGVFRIGLFYREARFQTKGAPTGPVGAYIVGLAFAFGWTPCVGPVLAAILMTAGAQESAGRGIALLGAYAAGIGIPFLLAALFVGPFLRFAARFRRHLGVVEKIMGAALVLTGILFMTGAMPAIGNWMLQTFPVFQKVG
jgi:cytochrome c-type biogenesis protein